MNQERVRLAQDVHDIVGHGLVAIQMQADVTRHLRQREPEPDRAYAALDAISRAAADALADLRTVLAVLMQPDCRADSDADCHADCGAESGHAPGLHLLPALRSRMEETGISVDVSLRGTRRSLPPAVDVAAYRVLQESLTNVVKHSSHPRADIEISYLPKALAVTVTNPDRPGGAPVEGIGLTGMRRRVTDVGGRLVVESNRPAGRFEVRVTFPTGP